MKPEIGECYSLVYSDENSTRVHVRGIVDGHLVLREWDRSSARWRYRIEPECWWEVNLPHLKWVRR